MDKELKKYENLFGNFSDATNFANEIDIFELELMKKLSEKIPFIGVSVQLLEEIQDDFSPTRQHPEAYNCYCSNIQNISKDPCNLFDIDAKNYYMRKENNDIDLLCFCHANVTNLLFRFRPNEILKYDKYTYDGPNFYIFLGHFLLNEYPSYAIKINYFKSGHNSDYKYIHPFKPISSIESYKIKNCKNDITSTSAARLLDAKLFTQERFLAFLQSGNYVKIDKDNKKIIRSEKLVKFENQISIKKIKFLLSKTERNIKSFVAIPNSDKTNYEEIQNKLFGLIGTLESTINIQLQKGKEISDTQNIDNLFDDFKLIKIYNWLKDGEKGSIGTRAWFNTINRILQGMKND